MTYQRKQKRSSRLSLVISLVLHGAVISALLIFAAREGMLGKQLKKIAVTMVPKEKPPEQPKPKPPEPKAPVEQPKEKPPRKPAEQTAVAPLTDKASAAAPSPAVTAPAVAPPADAIPAFEFGGGKTVETSSDPVVLYKNVVEYTFRSHWVRPPDIEDESFVAEANVSIDANGRVLRSEWKHGSGNAAWDASVKQALQSTDVIDRPPPKNFPAEVIVRFDVVGTENILQ